MRSKANKFNNTFILVIPNKKIVVFDMTFHIILPLTLQLMRIKLSRKIFPICQFRYYSIKQINLIKVFTLKSASNLNGNLNCSKELEHYAS